MTRARTRTRPLAGLLLAAVLAPPAAAHPLPNMRFDRAVAVAVTPAGVRVAYTLELNEWTLVLDGRGLFTDGELPGLAGSRQYAAKYAEKKPAVLADELRLLVAAQRRGVDPVVLADARHEVGAVARVADGGRHDAGADLDAVLLHGVGVLVERTPRLRK